MKKTGQEALSLRGAQGEKAAAKRETRSEAESTDKCVRAPKTGQTTKTGRKPVYRIGRKRNRNRSKLGHCPGESEEESPPPGANDVRLRQGELVRHLRINQSAAKRASATVTARRILAAHTQTRSGKARLAHQEGNCTVTWIFVERAIDWCGHRGGPGGGRLHRGFRRGMCGCRIGGLIPFGHGCGAREF